MKPTQTPHQLFLPESDSDPHVYTEDIGQINVRRLEPGGYVQATRAFSPQELGDLQALHGLFGGGRYELFARRATGQIMRKVLVTLPGPSKPMIGGGAHSHNVEEDDEEPRAYGMRYEPPSPPVAPAATAPPAASSDTIALLGMFMQMMQQTAQQQASQTAQMTQVLVAALSRGDQQTSNMMQAFSGVLTQALGQRSNANPVSEARQIVDLARELASETEVIEESGSDDMMNTIGQLAGAFTAANGTAKAGPQ